MSLTCLNHFPCPFHSQQSLRRRATTGTEIFRLSGKGFLTNKVIISKLMKMNSLPLSPMSCPSSLTIAQPEEDYHLQLESTSGLGEELLETGKYCNRMFCN